VKDPSLSASFVDSLKEVLRSVGDTVKLYHGRSLRKPIPQFQLNQHSILNEVCFASPTPDIAIAITNSIIKYASSQNIKIIALRATAVNWFSNEESSWPVVEWNEEDGRKSLAIFQFDDEMEDPSKGSWLMHSAYPDPVNDGDLSWRSSRLDWNVARMDDLEILVGAVYHACSLLQWSPEDLEQLCCHGGKDVTSEKEYFPSTSGLTMRLVRYLGLLRDHMQGLEDFQMRFREIIPYLEYVSRYYGKQTNRDLAHN